MAFALSMDAFSISVGMGMIGLRLRQIGMIGTTVGLFHVAMPLLGMILGKIVSQYVGVFAYLLGAIVLIILGLQMIFSSFSKDTKSFLQPVGLGLILFAVGVSIDSFSVGLSLGMLGAKTLLTLVSFGIMSAFLTCAGLLLGRKVEGLLGGYSEMLGGLILVGFGVKILFV
ncbi:MULTISPECIES: manganese efflux pump MntP family protein [Alteribacter]|uniref:Putative manganese efflux pump MntP n=1 Tax=Alteribacter keqinensis TaxID=2483800 RepID=A0A3M7TR84_9BACI|nr:MULTISPECIES: manganese efflux pump MntP family protein [Alteribacter]MBM7095576.1 manganese efflux pump [Alteribacter salitolerans]RNA68078.1 manganese efflux pump [Alteribacter keqinensis]